MKKVMTTLIILLLILTGAVYGGGVYFFSSHFLPGTKINSRDCSFLTVEEAGKKLEEVAEHYVLALHERDNGLESLTAEEIDMKYQPENHLELLLSVQDKWRWFMAFGGEKHLDDASCIDIDEERLLAAIDDLNCMQEDKIIAPADAFFEDNGTTFEIVPEVEGNKPDREQLLKTVKLAVLTGKNEIDLEKDDCYEKPSVREADPVMQKHLEQINQLTQVILTYNFEITSECVDRSVVKDWLIEDSSGDMVVDEEKAAEYVGWLADKYDEVGTEKTFRAYDGREMTVSGGSLGWMIDRVAETSALLKDIRDGIIEVREPIYAKRGVTRERQGLGDTYIEIDLLNQRLVYYKDGILALDTGIVSGDPYSNPTPIGIYSVGEKKRDFYLEKEVQNASYFVSILGDLGIHESVYREEFGGDIFMLAGTYGDVEISPEAAASLYENVTKGTPIVIYR